MLFGNVQFTIQDAQYRGVLKQLGQVLKPEGSIPIPPDTQLQAFLKRNPMTLENITSSPIGKFMFKEYLDKFLNMTIVIDFLIQYQRVKGLEAPGIPELEALLGLAFQLPGQYKKHIDEIQKQLEFVAESANEAEEEDFGAYEFEDGVNEGRNDSIVPRGRDGSHQQSPPSNVHGNDMHYGSNRVGHEPSNLRGRGVREAEVTQQTIRTVRTAQEVTRTDEHSGPAPIPKREQHHSLALPPNFYDRHAGQDNAIRTTQAGLNILKRVHHAATSTKEAQPSRMFGSIGGFATLYAGNVAEQSQLGEGGQQDGANVRAQGFSFLSNMRFPKTEMISAIDFEAEESHDLFPESGTLNRQRSLLNRPNRNRGSNAETELNDDDLDDNFGVDRNLLMMREEFMSLAAARQVLMDKFEKLGNIITKKATELLVTFRESREYKDMLNALWYAEEPLGPEDFTVYRDLGRGAFGVVSSVKHRRTGQLTALKKMSKRLIKGKKAHSLVTTEKRILQILGDNPSEFTVWLKYAFQDKEYYYMALPLCTGGDLSYHLKHSKTFDIDRVRFYIAEVIEGLAHLHSLGIIYRDLKPENVIVDSEGHCRVSDMGLATVTNGVRIKSRAGTPGYWAPEVVQKKFYSFAVDWWSLGVIMFECMLGVCPFSSTNTGMERDEATCYWKLAYPTTIQNGSDKDKTKSRIVFPEDARDLISGLLKRRQSKRYGLYEIRNHPFFETIDWLSLRRREVTPTFLPEGGEIFAGKQRHLDYKINEREFRDVVLGRNDNVIDYAYTSQYAHELDIMNVVRWRRRNPPRSVRVPRSQKMPRLPKLSKNESALISRASYNKGPAKGPGKGCVIM